MNSFNMTCIWFSLNRFEIQKSCHEILNGQVIWNKLLTKKDYNFKMKNMMIKYCRILINSAGILSYFSLSIIIVDLNL